MMPGQMDRKNLLPQILATGDKGSEQMDLLPHIKLKSGYQADLNILFSHLGSDCVTKRSHQTPSIYI